MDESMDAVMGLASYRLNDHGVEVAPETAEEWREWVSASKTRNWCEGDPLLDWLQLYGAAAGFERDPEPDSRTDFRAFIFRQGHAFEAAVVAHLERREGVCRMDGSPEWMRSPEACDETFAAMERGEAIIHQGLLRNPENRTYGAPDLLIRSDVLRRLFPDAIDEDEAQKGAAGLGSRHWHYRVVDVKYANLKFDRTWRAGSKHLAYMVQTAIYNEALGRIQGYEPPLAYLLGRGWSKGKNESGSTSSMDRLAAVPGDHVVGDRTVREHAGEAVAWVRRLRLGGESWVPGKRPCSDELLPNPKSTGNQPWHGAVVGLARELEDVTLAWQVGKPGREKARAAGIERWTDPRFTAAVADVNGVRGGVLDQALAVNRDPEGPAVWPPRIRTAVEEWGTARGVEFFVDFETVNSLDDDFARMPEQNGQALIFMIGCGHVEDGRWQFSCFIADRLDVASEANIVEAWLAHMETVRVRLAPGVERPLVFHWSPAETVTFGGLSSARTRSPEHSASWAEPGWFDFLARVMKQEPVIIRGPMGFGLKTVARSLKRHGLIETEWGDSVTDGLGAMVAAWWCAEEAARVGCTLRDLELMDDVRAYNEVDCQVMMEAIACLRGRVMPRGDVPD